MCGSGSVSPNRPRVRLRVRPERPPLVRKVEGRAERPLVEDERGQRAEDGRNAERERAPELVVAGDRVDEEHDAGEPDRVLDDDAEAEEEARRARRAAGRASRAVRGTGARRRRTRALPPARARRRGSRTAAAGLRRRAQPRRRCRARAPVGSRGRGRAAAARAPEERTPRGAAPTARGRRSRRVDAGASRARRSSGTLNAASPGAFAAYRCPSNVVESTVASSPRA